MNAPTSTQLDAIPGWFPMLDIGLFRLLLEETAKQGAGDVAELGVYLGKSAALIGGFVAPGETFTVVDLFDELASDSENMRENSDTYPTLTRAAFEANYRSVHPSLPVVIQGPSATIVDHAAAGTHRFVHVDASHLYEHVAVDIVNAERLLRSTGVLVLDDFRMEHTPGVAAAAWEAVAVRGLTPFALTPRKMYATWDRRGPWVQRVSRWAQDNGVAHEIQHIRQRPVVRLLEPAKGRIRGLVPPAMIPGLVWARARLRRVAELAD